MARDEDLFPHPQMGMSLFQGGDDWQTNAFLAYKYDATYTWTAYATGYKEAADIIVMRFQEDRSHIDYLVYPVVFLYRQYLELMLKQIILDGNTLLDISSDLPKVHSLEVLWRQCRTILNLVWPGHEEDALLTTDEIIKQICAVDPESTAFRYPTDRRGNPSVEGIEKIDLLRFGETMDKISTFLEGSALGISVYLEQKMEMEAAYKDYAGK